MTISVKSPTRVDLAGGTLDCWPLYLMVGDCVTVNLSIGIFTFVDLKERSDQRIKIKIADLNYEKTFSSLKEFLSSPDEELNLVRTHVEYWKPQKGFELVTRSESPVGGGLGGSSSLSVSLIKAFSQWMGRPFETHAMVTLASNLEAKVLGKPTGTQDYFPAIVSGLNIIHYTPEGAKVENVPFPQKLFTDHLILIYTGKAHHSGINNWQVLKAAIEGDQFVLGCLREIAEISRDTAKLCREGRWEDLPNIFAREYEARTRLSPGFSSPEIEQLQALVKSCGAGTVKICGAGGGGCVVVWASPSIRKEIEEECKKQGFQVLKAVPVANQ